MSLFQTATTCNAMLTLLTSPVILGMLLTLGERTRMAVRLEFEAGRLLGALFDELAWDEGRLLNVEGLLDGVLLLLFNPSAFDEPVTETPVIVGMTICYTRFFANLTCGSFRRGL